MSPVDSTLMKIKWEKEMGIKILDTVGIKLGVYPSFFLYWIAQFNMI